MIRFRPLLFLTALGCATVDGEPMPSEDSDTDPPIETIDAIVPTQLCVNEFVADSEESYQDETGAFPDWIELHNRTLAPLSLGEFSLTDDPEEPHAAPLDVSLIVPAGGFIVLSADGQPELGPTHLPFSLDAEGEVIGLFHSNGSGEVLAFGAVQTDFAWSRQTDCCAELPDCARQTWQGTPASSNEDG